MNDDALYDTTVPVLTKYIEQIDHCVRRIPGKSGAVLGQRLLSGTFTGGQHLRTAQNFSLRAIFPIIGQPIPALSTENFDQHALHTRASEILQHLNELSPADFQGASSQLVSHQAGDALLEQPAPIYVTQFALPNFFFHFSMGFASLRQFGVDLGKADFDRLHRYPPDFSFPPEQL